jgi:DNA-binding Xre family transcriptional regulator
MLKFNFTRVFKAKGIDKPYTYLVKAGYSASFATRVVNNKVRQLNLENVEKLCAMLQCTPNDLMEWIPGKNFSTEQSHPLSSLQRISNDSQINRILYNIPVDRLSEIEQLILKEVGK